MGVRKVGHVAATREPVEVRDISHGSHWIVDADWAERENIRGFIVLAMGLKPSPSGETFRFFCYQARLWRYGPLPDEFAQPL